MSFTKRNFIDADDSMLSVKNAINEHIRNGDFLKASQIANNNINIIGDRPNADFFNDFEVEIIKAEKQMFAKKTFIYYSDEIPETIEKGQVWIGGARL